MNNLSDSLVVITGGAGLLGSKFAEEVVKQGGKCLIADMNAALGSQIASRLNDTYGSNKAFFYSMDITSKDSIIQCISFCENELKIIPGALVNNAYPKTKDFGKDFFDVQYETVCKNLNSHLAGYLLCSQQFAEFFRKKRKGKIINIASIYGCIAPRFDIYEGTPMTNGPEYAMIKAGVVHLTKFMAQRLKGLNINVNCISPGGIADGQPASFTKAYRDYCSNKGMLEPDDLTGALIFLLSDAAKYIQGQNIIVDDGFSL